MGLDRTADIHAEDLCGLPDLRLQEQAQLVNTGHRRVRPPGELERVAVEMIPVAVSDQEYVAAFLLIDGHRVLGIAEPRIDEDYLPARGLNKPPRQRSVRWALKFSRSIVMTKPPAGPGN